MRIGNLELRFGAVAFVLCLLSLVLGCGREGSEVTAPAAVTVTNVVEVTREVVVTNEVTLTVTNVVVARHEPERVLSSRKTAPYAVSAAALDEAALRRLISDAGARAISCSGGAVALVEASDRAVKALRRVATVEAMSAEGKIAPDAGENVRVIPVSSIDSAAVAAAIRAAGGEIFQVVTVGSPAIRARVPYSVIRKLAERGDVRSVERDKK